MSLRAFEERAKLAISELRKEKGKEIIIVHHDDADGIASGAITNACLEREGYVTRTFCLEKVYPEVIEDIHSMKGGIVFYADIGSSHADLISKFNEGRNLIIILDHHDPSPATDPRVFDLNLENFGYKGETDFSGSTCCYLFARTLSEKNRDLAYLALVGSSEIPEGFVGLNKDVLDEAEKNKVVEVVGKSIKIPRVGTDASTLFSALQVLGAVGYYSKGPELGLKACIEGLTPSIKKEVNRLEEERKKANKKLLAILYKQKLKETEHIQWFDSGDVYAGMGTKVVGTFCSFLSFQARLIKPDKYILGLMKVPREIPNWGRLKEDLVKASIRTPKDIQSLIKERKMPGAFQLLSEASKGFGVADGHEFAANVTIPAGMVNKLIENCEKAISE